MAKKESKSDTLVAMDAVLAQVQNLPASLPPPLDLNLNEKKNNMNI